jgi:hypothetical protein
MGLHRSVNDFHALKKCRLNQYAIHEGLLDMVVGSHDGMPPYLLGNKVYPLLQLLHTKKKRKFIFFGTIT